MKCCDEDRFVHVRNHVVMVGSVVGWVGDSPYTTTFAPSCMISLHTADSLRTQILYTLKSTVSKRVKNYSLDSC